MSRAAAERKSPEDIFLELEWALEQGKEQEIRNIIDNKLAILLSANFAKAASLLSQASKNFAIAINSQMVMSAIPQLLERKFPVNEILHGLTVLGFGKEHLQDLADRLTVLAIMHCNNLSQNFSNRKSAAIINTLTHAKNLGLLENKKFEKNIADISTKLFSYLSKGKWHMLSESNFRACLDLAVYFQYVLKIENQNYEKLALSRQINFDSKISRPQKIIFNRIVNYLAHGFDAADEWQYNVKESYADEVKVGKFQVVSEYGYGKIGEKKVRSCDIAIVNNETGAVEMMIEVDGNSHFCNIEGAGLQYNGKTKLRDKIIRASCQTEVFHVSYTDFEIFRNKRKSQNFLSLSEKITELRQQLSEPDISQDIDKSYSIHEEEEVEENLPAEIQEIVAQLNIDEEGPAAAAASIPQPDISLKKPKNKKRKSKKAEKERQEKQENEKKTALFTSFKEALQQEKIDFEELSLLFDEYRKLYPQGDLIKITACFPNAFDPTINDEHIIDFVREIYDKDSVDLLFFLSRYVDLSKIKFAYNKIQRDEQLASKSKRKAPQQQKEAGKIIDKSNENGFIIFLEDELNFRLYEQLSSATTLEKIQALCSRNFIDYFRLAVINKDYGLLSFITASEIFKAATTNRNVIDKKYADIIRRQVCEALYDCLVRDDLFTAKIILGNLLVPDKNMSLLNPKKHGQEKGLSLLARACQLSNFEFIKYFVEVAGFNINEFREISERPPFFIVNNPEICDFFIERAFNPKEKLSLYFDGGEFQVDALADACIFGDEEKLRYLLDKGYFTKADLQENRYIITENKMAQSLNPLMLAIFYERHQFLQLLIEQGCDPNQRLSGLSEILRDDALDAMEFAFLISISKSVLPAIRVMLKGGYNWENVDRGVTILHKACRVASPEVISEIFNWPGVRNLAAEHKVGANNTPLDNLLIRIERCTRLQGMLNQEEFISFVKHFLSKLEPSEFEDNAANKILNFNFDRSDPINSAAIQYNLSKVLFSKKECRTLFNEDDKKQLLLRAIVNEDVGFTKEMLFQCTQSLVSFAREINENIASINPNGRGSKAAQEIAEACQTMINLQKFDFGSLGQPRRSQFGGAAAAKAPQVRAQDEKERKPVAMVAAPRPETPPISKGKGDDDEFHTPERPTAASKEVFLTPEGGKATRKLDAEHEEFHTP